MNTTIAILAGGQSVRMGRDKAQVTIEGEPLLARTVRVAREAGVNEVLIIGRERPSACSVSTVRFLPDTPERAGTGPLGGLATALENATTEAVLLLACDMPGLTANALRWLTAQVVPADTPDGIAVLGPDGELEPLFSLYTRNVLPGALARLQSGRRSLKSLIDTGTFLRIALPTEHGSSLINVNTPEELSAFLQSVP